MAEGQLEPTPSEDDLPLPVAKAPNFDLSDETVENNSNDGADGEVAETGAEGEPEGIFNLFDREFPPGERKPIEPSESGEFDREFSESFEEMFEAIRGDDSAPLFDGFESSETPLAPDSETSQEAEPKLKPEDEVTADRSLEDGEDQLEADNTVVETDSESLEDSLLPIPKPEQNSGPTRDISKELEELTLEDEFAQQLPSIEYDDEEFDPLDLSPDDEIGFESMDEEDYGSPQASAPVTSEPSETPLSDEEPLEELNFDDSDEEELYGEDLSGLPSDPEHSGDEFDEFAKLALGMDDDEKDEDDELDEEDDFVVEELDGAQELDPFEEVSIMSSEDVAKYEPSFSTDELKFKDDDETVPDDEDPFGDGGFDSADDEDSAEELDPFDGGPSSKAAEPAAEASKEDDDFDPNAVSSKGEGEKSGTGFKLPSFGPIAGILRLPWRIFSTVIDFLFGVLETVLKVLGGIPLIGLPFRVLAGVLSNIPAALKRVLVLVLIVLIFWGGGSLVGNLLPKPSVSIGLPDSGGAKFKSVELNNGKITGDIENTGAIVLQVFPQVEVSERKLFEPGSWFKPKKLGSCEGGLVEVPIDGTVKVSYDCKVAVDGRASLKPSLRE